MPQRLLAALRRGRLFGSVRKAALLLLVNGIAISVLFASAEFAVRLHQAGFAGALRGFGDSLQTPYSGLGTGRWVIFDEELGYRLNPASRDVNEFSIRHGEVTLPKPESTFRILVLADSLGFNNGFVEPTQALLEAGNDRIEVINAAVPGYTSYQEALFFEKHVSKVEPDLVLWSYCANDNHRFLHRFDPIGHMLWTDEARASLEIDSRWDQFVSRSLILSRVRVALVGQAQRRYESDFPWEDLIDFNSAWKDHSWRQYEEDLERVLEVSERIGARLSIIVFPFEPQLLAAADPATHDYVVKPQRKVAELCQRHSVPCLDLYPILRPLYDRGDRFYVDGVHMNETGNALAARSIEAFLDAENLLGKLP